MFLGNNLSKVSITIFMKAIFTVLFFLAVDVRSAIHLEIVQEIDDTDVNLRNWFTPEDYRADLLCPSSESIGNCTCAIVADELFLNCSAVQSEEELALVFQQDFPMKNFSQFDLNSNPNISYLGPISNGISFERIYLDFNVNLTMITDEFLLDSLNTLKFLQIKFSQLYRATFPFSMLPFFNKLETLNIESSELLTSIPKLESDSLRVMSFYGSAISTLEPGTFDGIPQLVELQLPNNKLTSLESGSFRVTDNLHNIYLYDNSIASIDSGAFVVDEENGTLEYLVIDLAPNLLSEIRAGTFQLPDCSVSLILADNGINTIRPGAFLLPSTTDDFSLILALENNQIMTVDEDVFGAVFPHLTTLRLYNNPLACGCDLAWIVFNSDYMEKIDSLATCADGINLHSLNPDDFERFC